MKIGLVQSRFRPGDTEGNIERIISGIQREPADLYLLPASGLTGFWSRDQDEDAQNVDRAMERLEQALGESRALLFLPSGPEMSFRCLVLERGQRKELELDWSCLIPRQGANSISLYNFSHTFGRTKIALMCIASEFPIMPPLEQLEDLDLLRLVKECDLVCICSLLPWSVRHTECEQSFCTFSRHWLGPVFLVQALGLSDGLICAGGSLVLQQGKVLTRLAVRREDSLVVEVTGENLVRLEECTSVPQDPLVELWETLTWATRTFVDDCNCSTVLIGVSGGIDSALVLAIACEALGPENVCALLMPSPYTSAESLQDAEELVARLGPLSFTLPITPMMKSATAVLDQALSAFKASPQDVTLENVQARIRGLLVTSLANRARALVLNTSNKSEMTVGYSTLYGDSVGAVSVIGDLTKTTVYELARWYNERAGSRAIPERILTRAPSAELRPDQKDSDSLPEYAKLDSCIEDILTGRKLQDEIGSWVKAQLYRSAFKRRQEPVALVVSPHPLSLRNYPVNTCFRPVVD